MERIDEMTNEDLERRGHSDYWLRLELERVLVLVKSHAMTGVDLDYWFERELILRTLIHGFTAAL